MVFISVLKDHEEACTWAFFISPIFDKTQLSSQVLVSIPDRGNAYKYLHNSTTWHFKFPKLRPIWNMELPIWHPLNCIYFEFWIWNMYWNTSLQLAKYNNGTAINDPCSEESLLTGFSSLEECHQIIIATSVCKPRKLIYMIFLLLVPVFILFCAQFWLPTYIA